MAGPEFGDDTAATALFPQFDSLLYEMVVSEVEGLTDGQLDFESDRWEWSGWSIRRNLSHVASGDFRWLWGRWGQQLFSEGLPNAKELDALLESPQDRRLDEQLYWDLESILEKMRQGLELCWTVLATETAGSLRSKELEIDSSVLCAQHPEMFPGGIREYPGDPNRIYITLGATLLHRYYEYLTHLFNIQRLKRAQGLETVVDIPFQGYWALPDWDRSEP